MYSIQPVATDSLATSVTPIRANFSILQTMLGPSSVASEHRISSVGDVKMWTGYYASITTSNPGWLHCDGSAVSRTTYADLYGVIRSLYGDGDTTTTFNLPSFTSVFVRGSNTNPGSTGGADTCAVPSHTLTTAEIPAHRHVVRTDATAGTGEHAYAGSGAKVADVVPFNPQ